MFIIKQERTKYRPVRDAVCDVDVEANHYYYT